MSKGLEHKEDRVLEYLEDLMAPADRIAFEKELQADPSLKAMLRQFEQTIISPDETISFSNKSLLKKSVPLASANEQKGKSRRLYYFSAAVAASLLLFLLLNFPLGDQPNGTQIVKGSKTEASATANTELANTEEQEQTRQEDLSNFKEPKEGIASEELQEKTSDRNVLVASTSVPSAKEQILKPVLADGHKNQASVTTETKEKDITHEYGLFEKRSSDQKINTKLEPTFIAKEQSTSKDENSSTNEHKNEAPTLVNNEPAQEALYNDKEEVEVAKTEGKNEIALSKEEQVNIPDDLEEQVQEEQVVAQASEKNKEPKRRFNRKAWGQLLAAKLTENVAPPFVAKRLPEPVYPNSEDLTIPIEINPEKLVEHVLGTR